ncbi:conserved unknown protein [Ectocarpus siliculosus]|uniref:Replication factor C subunit 1 n=1 Tax=Ectocarpus siliculosus TaxID=2880 RepID=D8LND0_ECTSI|nr:conserved unknown protein [Ectocarpus siliculosus]|eukprot:CBN77287.1 conserved unknown protein [Ectocarpus siliculosus]
MDIRSFFGPSSGGAGGAAKPKPKPKTPASASKKGGGQAKSPSKKATASSSIPKNSSKGGVGKMTGSDAKDEESDEDDDDDDADDDVTSKSRKRKSGGSPAPKAAAPPKVAAAAASPSKASVKTKKKRAVVEEDEEDDDVQEVASSKHFSSATTKKKTAAPGGGGGGGGGGSRKTTTSSTVDLGGTSSDEDDAQEEEVAPTPPPKKKPAPASSSGSAKKTPGGGGGGGGFRPAWRGGARLAPPNEGKKEVPVGKEQCLAGKAFVVSGVLDSLGREAAEDLIKQYGGKVTGAVSSRTHFLVLGTVLDDGRPPEEGSKYKRAMVMKTRIIDEDGLFKMLRDSNPKGQQPPGGGSQDPSSAAAAPASKPAVANPYQPKKAVVNPYASMQAAAKKKAAVNPFGAAVIAGGKGKAPAGKSPAGTSSSSSSSSKAAGGARAAAAVRQNPGQMWVDKYKPTSSSGVIGHAGQVKKLKVWLQNWEGWHLKGAKAPTGKDNPGARAALLSGVPGVGKSSTATLVAREMGYHVMELNASDTRSKRSLSEELASVIGNKVLSFTANGGGGGTTTGGFRKQLVVMDEVDGMGGSDRGGIQELILLIKKSRVPIIAICNDRQHQKIRSLVNHCYDLRFARPQKVTIAKRVKAVAKMEGMDVDDNAAEMLVEANGNDIRQVLHALQMWSRKSSKMTYMNLKGGISAIEKDKNQRIGPFDAARSILGGASRTPLRDRYELFFTDYSLLPLLVHQNYLSSLMQVDAKVRTEVTAAASAAVSDADIISGKMRGDVQHWELLPAQAALNVRVGSVGGGSLGFPEFPKWLGNYSRENKRRRLLGELSTHLNASVSGGTEAVRLSYIHFLKRLLTQPLREEGAAGAPACVDLLEEYGLSRDDLFEVLPEFVLSGKGMKRPPPDLFGSLDSKTRSAVTRCYNSQAHKSQALAVALQAPKKAKKRKAPPKSVSMEGKSRSSPAASKKGKATATPRSKKTKK